MIIHPSIPKRKKKKPTAKQRALNDSWQKLLEKYDVKPIVTKTNRSVCVKSTNSNHRRTIFDDARSMDTGSGLAPKKSTQQYTGDAMIGIGQLHKSNAVPIFKQEDAVSISKMRRG